MRLKSLLVLVILFIGIESAYAATRTSQGSGAWSTGSTWVGGVAPAAGDDVIITSNHIVSITGNQACLSLTLNQQGILNYAGNFTLTITNGFTSSGPLNQIIGNNALQTMNVATFTVTNTGVLGLSGITLNVSGVTNISGYFALALNNAGTKTFNNTITVFPGGTWDDIIGEDVTINCDIVNRGNWPAPTGGGGVYSVTANNRNFVYTGPKVTTMNELRITGTNTTVVNYTFLALTGTGTNLLDVAATNSFTNGDGTGGYLYMSGSGAVNNNGTVNFSRPNNLVEYNFAGNQPVFGTVYSSLAISNSGTKTLTSDATVQTAVSIVGSALFDVTTNTFDGTANLTMTGTSTIRFAKTGATLPELTGTSNSLAAGTTIAFNGAGAQTAKGSSVANPSTTNTYPYQNFALSGSNASSLVNIAAVSLIQGNLTLTNLGKWQANPPLTVGGTFTFSSAVTQAVSANMTIGSFLISAGTLNYSNRTITLNGTNGAWTNNGGGLFINGNSFVVFTGGANQQINGTASTSFSTLTINNTNNVTVSGVDVNVTTALNLTAGRLITGANNVYISTATVSRTSGYVDGNLQRDLAAGLLRFDVGSGLTYAPVDLTFTGPAGGVITVSTTAGDHPGIASSNIEPTRTANRYWTVRNSGGSITSFDAVFNYVAGDLDGTAVPGNFAVRSTANSGVTWAATTTGTRTSTSVQILAEPGATLPAINTQVDFQSGELIAQTNIFNRITGAGLSWNSQATWIENRTGSITTNGTTTVSGVGTLFTSELAVGNVIMFQSSSGTVQGTIAAIANNTSLTLVGVAPGSATGTYGRQRIPNLPGDVVTIGNPLITPDAATSVNFDIAAGTTINTLNINSAVSPRTTAQSLTHAAGSGLLTVKTNVVVNQPNGSLTNSWNINAGTAAVPGTVSIGSAINNNASIGSINITTGTLSLGNFLFNTANNASNEATAAVNLTGAGTINMAGSLNFSNNRGTLNPGTTSTFNYNGTAPQLLVFPSAAGVVPGAFKYNNITVNNTTGVTISPTGRDITTTNTLGDFRIQTGTLITGDNTDIAGNAAKTFRIDPGAIFRMTGNASTFPTGYGTFNLGTTAPFGTVSYEQQSPTTITGVSFGNLNAVYSGITYSVPATGASVAGTFTVGDGTSSPTVVGLATTSFVVRDVVINKNATLNANSGTRLRSMTVGGNWTNDGTFTPGPTGDTGLTFTGTSVVQPQVISGTATETFTNMVVNTPAASLIQLNKALSITGTLTLTQGGVDLNQNILNITSSATAAITRTSGYIRSESTTQPYGEINWTLDNSTSTFTYPFGRSSTQYIPVTVNITQAASAGASVKIGTYPTPANNTPFPGTVTNLNGTGGGASVVDRFWILTTLNATIRPIVTLTLTALATEKPATIPSLAAVTTNPAGITGQNWTSSNYWNAVTSGQTFANNPGPATFATTIPLQLIPATQTPYALTDAAQPLPIKLANFAAVSRTGFVELTWKTETEIDNDYFTVERSDGVEGFGDIATVKGAGNSTTPKDYKTFDYGAGFGRWYYRLKQTDINGSFTYSKIITVDVTEGIKGVFPNPSSGLEFNINFLTEDLGKDVLIKVQDISGREISQAVVQGLNDKKLKLEFAQKLPSGIYIVSILVGNEIIRQKIVVN